MKHSRNGLKREDLNIHIDTKGQSEDALQQKAFFWFTNTFPTLRKCFFAVPNGGGRDVREGKKFKLTGLVPGVADTIFCYKGTATFIELKTETGTQSQRQKDFQKAIEAQGFEYYLIRSLQEFKELIFRLIPNLENI